MCVFFLWWLFLVLVAGWFACRTKSTKSKCSFGSCAATWRKRPGSSRVQVREWLPCSLSFFSFLPAGCGWRGSSGGAEDELEDSESRLEELQGRGRPTIWALLQACRLSPSARRRSDLKPGAQRQLGCERDGGGNQEPRR